MNTETVDSNESKEPEPVETNWVVITGPPSSGKTTTIEDLMRKLESSGFTSVEEQARKLINEDRTKGIQRLGDREYEIALNNRVLSRRKKIEDTLSPISRVLMDRGTPDVVAYMRHYRQDEEEALRASAKFRYAKVFYLEPLVSYEQDRTRVEDPEFAKWMHENLPNVYKELEYEVVRVSIFPYGEGHYDSDEEKKKDSLDQRSRFIMEKMTT